ncbi:MAG: hypothetical protein WAN22_12075 [Solirubrobacteraceae bacterium]
MAGRDVFTGADNNGTYVAAVGADGALVLVSVGAAVPRGDEAVPDTYAESRHVLHRALVDHLDGS